MGMGLVVLEEFLVVRRRVAFFDLSDRRFGVFLENFGCSAWALQDDREAVGRSLPRSPICPLQRYYNVHRIFLAKSTARLRHPRGRLDPAGGRVCGCLAGASEFPPDLGAGLAARSDRDPGWSPWPTPRLQTRMIASTAPRATSPAQSPTSPGHGWRSYLPSQRLQSRTAPTVMTTSTPASSRPYANCTRPWQAIPDDLASLPADMESIASCRRS